MATATTRTGSNDEGRARHPGQPDRKHSPTTGPRRGWRYTSAVEAARALNAAWPTSGLAQRGSGA